MPIPEEFDHPFAIGMLCHSCGSFAYGIFYKEECPDCPGERILTLRTADGKTYAYAGKSEKSENIS